MIKYVVAVFILVLAVGAFLYSSQTVQAPTEQVQEEQNPFGDGSTTVGALDGNGSATEEAGVVSRAVLATHNTQADCWVGYKGIVYDVTNWLPRHPGTAAAIAPYCGTAEEFAAAFNQQHGTRKEGKLQKEGVNEGTLGN